MNEARWIRPAPRPIPAIAGYLWLLFIWLVADPDVVHRPNGALGQSVYDLGHEVGRPSVFAAVSVAAYLVGALSQEIAPLIRAAGARFVARFGPLRARCGSGAWATVSRRTRAGPVRARCGRSGIGRLAW
jgi:hypothetical protein